MENRSVLLLEISSVQKSEKSITSNGKIYSTNGLSKFRLKILGDIKVNREEPLELQVTINNL